jgi:hypothetical protein
LNWEGGGFQSIDERVPVPFGRLSKIIPFDAFQEVFPGLMRGASLVFHMMPVGGEIFTTQWSICQNPGKVPPRQLSGDSPVD